jgi:hypothetical protein
MGDKLKNKKVDVLIYTPLDKYRVMRKKNSKIDDLVKKFNLDLVL